MNAQSIIDLLQLEAHPEGGYYRETYRCSEEIDLPNYQGNRNISTGIYYMLVKDKISAFHKIKQDEMWHYYKGDPLELHIITSDGTYKKVIIGNDLHLGETPQYVVKGGDFFAARLVPGADYSLVGCTVAPGFDFKDFDMPSRQVLLDQFHDHTAIIKELTYP